MSSNSTTIEKREGERVAVRERVQYRAAGVPDYETGEILNLSTGGVLLSTRRPMVTGTRLEIQLTPLGHQQKQDFVAQIVRIEHGGSKAWWGGSKATYRYGCRISSVSAAAQDAPQGPPDDGAEIAAVEWDEDAELPTGYEVIDLSEVVEHAEGDWLERVDEVIEMARSAKNSREG